MGRFGKGVAVVSDNDSKNMRDAEAFLWKEGIRQYWTKPKFPKEKPYVERLIGAIQKEYLDYHYEPINVRKLAKVTDSWLDKAPSSETKVFDLGDTSTAPMNP
ncbi:MAG: hypothetical protein LBG84_01575 [Treponema sp.]|jgi:hypothetical protein|nr:hypothetical protein [Treponema sp.]